MKSMVRRSILRGSKALPVPAGHRFLMASVAAVVTFLFTFNPSALQAGPPTVLHTFTGLDGAYTDSTLTETHPGVFYGTAGAGGATGCGTLFRITAAGVYTKLHDFTSGIEGCGPSGQLLHASDGNLYGVTTEAYPSLLASIFRSDLAGNVTVLHAFAADGFVLTPYSPVEATDGNLYFVIANGPNSAYYRMTLGGTLTQLAIFPSGSPAGSLFLASDGNFYGQTFGGVYRATPSGTITSIFTFPSAYFGVLGSLVQASDGRLYGTNPTALYTLLLSGGDYQEIFNFQFNNSIAPSSGLGVANDGHIYGVCIYGGLSNQGVLYRSGTKGFFTVLDSFNSAATYPETPGAAVVQGSDGLLYGTTLQGGPASGTGNGGTVYNVNLGMAPPAPYGVSFAPSTGAPGTPVLIRGEQILGVTSVSFNGVPASFVVNSSGFLTATVPAGVTSGPISVTTANGTGTSHQSFEP